jgi:tRNA(adenine34) deaminase
MAAANNIAKIDKKYMKMALNEAKKALLCDEVPVGAVIVKDGKVLARAYNVRNKTKLATAHAEMLAVNKACRKLGDWRLNGCTMYVTLEPCMMCAGACLNARMDKVVFGAADSNGGVVSRIGGDVGEERTISTLNHTLTVVGGVLAEECSEVLTGYFRGKRKGQ